MKNDVLMDKFNKNFNILKTSKNKNDYLNWILNQNYMEF